MATNDFMRFRWSDPQELEAALTETHAKWNAVSHSGNTPEMIEAACDYSVPLNAADREAEAFAMLQELYSKTAATAPPRDLAWLLHHLATAQQYASDKRAAISHFDTALTLCAKHGLREIEHYVWHHKGRCHAELGEFAKARQAFQTALELRLALNEPRASRSREALALLDELENCP